MEVLLVPADADDPSGREVVHKTATMPGERDRLRREAEVLYTAAARGVHGVATVVTPPAADAAEPTLVTAAVAGPSLALAPPLPIREVAGVAAQVAGLLAGLHEAGLVHGAVEPSHVVLDGEGGAILVGLGDGGEVGGPAAVDANGQTALLDPATDVAGWGALLTHLLDWSATGDEPLVALRRAIGGRPRRRWAPMPTRVVEEERGVLAALADQAQDPDPARRPTARTLAATIAHRVPTARPPGATLVAAPPPARRPGLLDRLSAHVRPSLGDSASEEPGRIARDAAPPSGGRGGDTRSDGRPAATHRRGEAAAPGDPVPPDPVPPDPGSDVGFAASRAGSAAQGWRLRRPPRPTAALPLARGYHGGPDEAGPSPAVPLAAAGARQPRRPTLGLPPGVALIVIVGASLLGATWVGVVARRPPSAAARAPIAATGRPAPSGCPPAAPPAADVDGDGCEETVREVGGEVRAGAARFALGAPGDAWVLGDWHCDGRRTPAVLHAGSVAVFDAWPGPGSELAGRPVATDAAATRLAVVAGPDGCDRLALGRPGGPDLVVDPDAPP